MNNITGKGKVLRSGTVTRIEPAKPKSRKGSKNQVEAHTSAAMTDDENEIETQMASKVEIELNSKLQTLTQAMNRLVLEKTESEKAAHAKIQDMYARLEELSSVVRDLKTENAELKDKQENENVEAPPVTVPSYIFDPLVSIPCYDPTRMTPEAFLLEVEEHLTWKNADKSSWLLLVTRMFKKESDISRWWRETKINIKSWDSFKVAFMKYEESGISKDILLAQLFAKRQRLNEVFETFAWDVNGAYRKINPRVLPAEVIDRIINSSLPEIAVMLRNCSFNSVAELIFKAREIISDLNKGRQREGKPQLLARNTDVQINNEYSRNRNSFRKPWNSYTRGSTENSKELEQDKSKEEPTPGSSTAPASEPSSSSSNRNSSYGRQNNYLKDMACYYCEKKGHMSKDCRKRKYDERQKGGAQSKQNSEPKN
jgi:hypothetical protein